MNLTIACSYCRRQIVLKISSTIIVNGRSSLLGGPVRCEACDSTTQIEISTKRVRKGKGMRDIEVRAQARIDLEVERCRKRNAAIGAKLLEQPGCRCAALHADYPGRGHTDRGRDGGHYLSTGWSRDDKTGGMLPTLPHHYHHCACHGTAEERQIIEGATTTNETEVHAP